VEQEVNNLSEESPDPDTYRWYLYDLGYLLKEQALEAKANKELHSEKRDEDYYYYMGLLMGYMYTISLMQSQAISFGIPLKDLQLDDVIPEVHLL
jgi:hypothetical protein